MMKVLAVVLGCGLVMGAWAHAAQSEHHSAPTITIHPAKDATSPASNLKKEMDIKKQHKDAAKTFYKALLKCKKGFYTFPNPMFSKQVLSKQFIGVNILGDNAGMCEVNMYFDKYRLRLNCLYTADQLKALASTQNVKDFNNAYAKGYLDSHKATAFDTLNHEVCQAI